MCQVAGQGCEIWKRKKISWSKTVCEWCISVVFRPSQVTFRLSFKQVSCHWLKLRVFPTPSLFRFSWTLKHELLNLSSMLRSRKRCSLSASSVSIGKQWLLKQSYVERKGSFTPNLFSCCSCLDWYKRCQANSSWDLTTRSRLSEKEGFGPVQQALMSVMFVCGEKKADKPLDCRIVERESWVAIRSFRWLWTVNEVIS